MPPPWTRSSGMPSITVSPTAHATSTTTPAPARRARRGLATSIAWITAGPPRWTSSWLTAGSSSAGSPRRPAVLATLEQRVVPLDHDPPLVAGIRRTREIWSIASLSTSSTKNTTLTSSSAIATQSVNGGTLPVPPRSTHTMAASE